MSDFDYDLIVIGAGSGGTRTARISASYGAKTLVIEGDRAGGTCVLRGCVPKKLLVYASQFSEQVSDAEGFGLSTLESLACETPIIVNMTGGLQEQVTNGTDWFGIGLRPSSKAIIGSQDVPYIYEDRIDKNQFMSALSKMYNMSSTSRREMGNKGREHVLKNYNFRDFNQKWIEIMDELIENNGSWENRKGYSGIYFGEVA